MNIKESIANTVGKIVDSLLGLIKPRVLFTFMFFGVTAYLVIEGKKIPELVEKIDIGLISFYFGEKIVRYIINGKKEHVNEK